MLLSGCDTRTQEVSAGTIPTPTPFQPDSNASDSLYAGAAPTPFSLPTFTPAPVPTFDPAQFQADQPTAVSLPVPLNPLTGLPFSDSALWDRRPLAVKIANYPRYVRPQSGLTLADQVFEYYIEDGLTRFTAVFYGNDSEWVGPVRSGRFFDENIQRMYQAYLVFKFADKRVLEHFKATDFADFLVVPSNGACPPFRIMESRSIEVYNNSYFDTAAWNDCVEQGDLLNNAPSFYTTAFRAEYAPLTSLPGDLIRMYYSPDDYHYWEYDPETGEYYRFQETRDIRNGRDESYAPLVDAVTGETVHAANVVFLFAYHSFNTAYEQDDEVYSIDLTGSGEAYVFRDGLGIVARWHRPYNNQPLTFTDAHSGAILLKPGITFYEVIGRNSSVDQGEGEWNFHHETP